MVIVNEINGMVYWAYAIQNRQKIRKQIIGFGIWLYAVSQKYYGH